MHIAKLHALAQNIFGQATLLDIGCVSIPTSHLERTEKLAALEEIFYLLAEGDIDRSGCPMGGQPGLVDEVLIFV